MRLLRCWFKGTHAPVLVVEPGHLYVSCRSCGWRSHGIVVQR